MVYHIHTAIYQPQNLVVIICSAYWRKHTKFTKLGTPVFSIYTFCTGTESILTIYKVSTVVELDKIKIQPSSYSSSSLVKNERLSITKLCRLYNLCMTMLHALHMKGLASSCATLLNISCFAVIHRPLLYRSIAIFHLQKSTIWSVRTFRNRKMCPTFNLTESGISSYSLASALVSNVMWCVM